MSKWESFFKTNSIDRCFLGFDNFFEDVTRLMRSGTGNYPPYNIVEDDNTTSIEIAVAGFKKSEIEVREDVKDGRKILLVSGKKQRENDREYAYRGLSNKDFALEFYVDKSSEVSDVTLVDGILNIVVKFIRKEESSRILEIK